MSNAVPSACACPTPVSIQTPGPQGANGANGANGVNAFSITQANFVVPAINSSVTVTVDNNSWMVIGQNVFVFSAGYFSVNSLSGTTAVGLTYLNYVGNTAAGNTVTAGAQVSPAGTQGSIPNPLPIANGGTNSTTKASAQTALGLGQNATDVTVTGLTQDLTASFVIVAGATVTAPAAGLYLILAKVILEYRGATFASSRTFTMRVQNTTQSTTAATQVATTGVFTTTDFPSIQYTTPVVTSTLALNDVLEVDVEISVVPSAGTARVISANLCLVPLALS